MECKSKGLTLNVPQCSQEQSPLFANPQRVGKQRTLWLDNFSEPSNLSRFASSIEIMFPESNYRPPTTFQRAVCCPVSCFV